MLVYIYQSVVVKGLERNISCIYEARCLLLGLDSCEPAKVTEMTSDPLRPSTGLTSYWLNMLLQQLRLSEQGEDLRRRVSIKLSRKLKFPALAKGDIVGDGRACCWPSPPSHRNSLGRL